MMNFIKPLLFLAAITILSCNNSSMELTKSEMQKILEERNTLLGNCFKEGNAEKLSQMYSPEAKLCPNGYHFVHERDSIKAFWEDDFKTSKVISMSTSTETIDGNHDIIYETGITTSEILYNDSIYHYG